MGFCVFCFGNGDKEETDGIQIDYIAISPLTMLKTDLEVDGKYPPVIEALR